MSAAWSVDLAGTGTFPRGPHRMADPRVRVRAMLASVLLLGSTWGAIALLGRPGCAAFSARETRELASLPVMPACLQGRLPPTTPGMPNLFPGASP